MSKCVEKLPHKCGSRDGLQVFLNDDGRYTGYCFSCNTYEENPYHDKPKGYKPIVLAKSSEEVQAELEQIGKYQIVALPDRKLRRETLERYGVTVGVSETDGVTPTTHHYPYTKEGIVVGYKTRLVNPKKMWVVGSIKDVDFFGWDQAIGTGSKKLFITEGEIDALSLYQILKDQTKGTQWEHLEPAVVSLISGAGSAPRDIAKRLDKIKKYFQDVVLVFDSDDPGRKAAEEVSKLVPEVHVATLPVKDVNDGLVAGKSKAVFAAVQFKASKLKNSRIVIGSEIHEAAKKPPEFGYDWPWKHITEKTRGIRLGETIYIGAAQKMGKSEVVNTLAAHFIQRYGWKVFLAKPEEANNKTYKLVAGKICGKFFHDPTKQFDEDAFDKAGEIIGDKLLMLNIYQHMGWEGLKTDIRTAALEGCKAIIIDPITNLVNGLDAATANTKLQEIAQELSAMALDLNVVIFIFCHLRNPDSGLPHERGGEVLSSQFAGSRAMARSCNLMLGIEGNRDPNLTKEEKNLRTLVLLEDREFGETGRFLLYWDDSTGLFNELV